MVRARYKLSLVFRLSTFCSHFKFMLSAGIQLFSLKTTPHGKFDLKNEFSRHVYHVKWFSGQKVEYRRKHELELAANRDKPDNQAGLRPGPVSDKIKNFKFFPQKSNLIHCLFST